ncbi:MAG: hypothetical protein WC635_12515 [Bacteriovorax sp.]|jgi:hypothetical protein
MESNESVLAEYVNRCISHSTENKSTPNILVEEWFKLPLDIKLSTILLKYIDLSGENLIFFPIFSSKAKQFSFVFMNEPNVSSLVAKIIQKFFNKNYSIEMLDNSFDIFRSDEDMCRAVGIDFLVTTYWKFRSAGFSYNKSMKQEEK